MQFVVWGGCRAMGRLTRFASFWHVALQFEALQCEACSLLR